VQVVGDGEDAREIGERRAAGAFSEAGGCSGIDGVAVVFGWEPGERGGDDAGEVARHAGFGDAPLG